MYWNNQTKFAVVIDNTNMKTEQLLPYAFSLSASTTIWPKKWQFTVWMSSDEEHLLS